MGVGAGFCMCDVVVNKFTFAISSPDEFLQYNIIQQKYIYIILTTQDSTKYTA